ncbi:MAG TPA: hypothetical protein VKX16_10275 [Chloroflexota bacterium]|nr:hypothetical protein [Chloroflexota bacterium]
MTVGVLWKGKRRGRVPLPGKGALLIGSAFLSLMMVESAWGFTGISPPFTKAKDLVTNPPTCNRGFGEVSLLGGVSDATHLYFDDYCNDTTYRFGLKGGPIAKAQLAIANGLNLGLAISNGSYFGLADISSSIPSGLYAFNPNTLVLGPLLVPNSSFGGGYLAGITADPLSSDLYVSSGVGIYRVQNPLGTPIVTQFAAGSFDGLAFKRDGSVLYAAAPQGVAAFDRNGNLLFGVPISGGPDGIAVAPHGKKAHGLNVSDNVFVNTNSGNVVRIDVNNGNAVSTVATGGTRGDFVFVDAKGFLDVSQSDRYVRLYPNFFK